MPRYFFNIRDGETIIDDEGTELPDLDAARAEAIGLSGEMLHHGPRATPLWDGTSWEMWVTDESERTLFTLRFSAPEALGEI
jgi:hypothetical protein